jgi:UDP-glucose 4-epimerase
MAAKIKDKRILVTGGAGFIGNEVARQLAAGGARVTVLDNLVNGKRENLADVPTAQCRLQVGDIRDLDVLTKAIEGQDAIIHMACLGVRHSIHAPVENHDVNATATLKLLELAKQRGIARFTYISSSEVYGTAQTAPMTEQHPCWPMTVYGSAKLAGERYTDAFWRTYRYPTTVVRPFNAFGPRSHHEGDSGEVIPKFLLRALSGKPLMVHGNGEQTRDFTYVADTAAGIIACALSDDTIGETINLGSGAEVTINALAELVRKVTGRNQVTVEHGPDRPGDVRRLIADIAKAQRLISFKTSVSLEAGLTKLLDWYRSLDVSAEQLLADEQPINWAVAR